MALDEPKDKDEIVELDGITYLIDAVLIKQACPIKVDYVEDGHCSGFAITSVLSKPEGCGPCSC